MSKCVHAKRIASNSFSISSFNTAKSCLLCFPNRSTHLINYTYHLGDSAILSHVQCRDLGVLFFGDLSWAAHYNSISAKAYRQLGLIGRTFSSSVSVRVKKLLYLTLVRSQLTYCPQIWRSHLIKDILFLEKILRWASNIFLLIIPPVTVPDSSLSIFFLLCTSMNFLMLSFS